MNTAPTLGVVTTDRQLNIRSWNDWVASATGLQESAVAGRSLLDFVAAERADYYRDLLAEVIRSGSARVLAPAFHKHLIECAPRTRSRHFSHMQQRVTIAPLLAGTQVAGLMITLEDVTERLDRERSLAALDDPADSLRRTDALASEDWQVRGQAVRQLTQTATVDEVRHLFDTLQRDHHDLNVLNSALRVLIAAGRGVVEPLVQLLSDEAANLRMHAALALGELRAEQAAPDLVGRLDDPDENVRFHAIEALGRIGATESIDPLARIAASENFFLAFAAIAALSKTDDARVAPLMVSLLDQEMLRPAAVATLAAIGDEDCVAALARSLNQPGETGPIAGALARIHARYEDTLSAGSFIVETARAGIDAAGREHLAAASRRSDAHREAVVTVLGWLGHDALEVLLPLLGEEPIHATLGDSIVAIGAPAVEPLIERLESASPTTRVAAAELLGRIGDRRAVPNLILALGDTDATLATAAAAALGQIGDGDALDGLMTALGHPHAAVRRAAIAAINAIGADATASRIKTALGDDDPKVRESAVRIAGYFGFRGTVPAVVAALTDPVEDVRRAAIEQLPVLEDFEATDALLRALATETPRNRAAAAHALRLVDDERPGPPLLAALNDPDSWVRYFAATSLREPQYRSQAAEPLARLATSEPATHVRIAAIASLESASPALAARIAAHLIADPDDNLAIAAIKVLAASRSQEVDAHLEQVTRSSRPALQLAAIEAMASRPTVHSVEVLAWAARAGGVPGMAEGAIDALREIAATDVQPLAQRAAVTALRDLAAEGTRRLEVIAALARLPEFAVPEVASGLSESRISHRIATADALAAMHHPRASSELARALRDTAPAVRAAAIAGFSKLGTPAVGRTIAIMRQADPDEGVRRRAEMACVRHGWGSGPLLRS